MGDEDGIDISNWDRFVSGFKSFMTPGTDKMGNAIQSPFSSVMGGLSSVYNIYGGLKQGRLARDMFNFNRDFSLANLQAQTTAYNNTRADMLRTAAGGVPERIAAAQALIPQQTLGFDNLGVVNNYQNTNLDSLRTSALAAEQDLRNSPLRQRGLNDIGALA